MASRGAGAFESRVREFEPRDTLAQTFTYASTTGVFGALFAGTCSMGGIEEYGRRVLMWVGHRYPEHHDTAEPELHGLLHPLRRHHNHIRCDGRHIRIRQELLRQSARDGR